MAKLQGRYPALSFDGRYVAFTTFSALVPGDTNSRWDAYVRDRVAGITTLVSLSTTGQIGNNSTAETPSISDDGRFVAFSSPASNLVVGDTNNRWDVFVRDRQAGTTSRVSISSSGTQANADSEEGPSISANGRFVAFESSAPNLVAGDTNGSSDVFVHDRQTGTTTRVSLDSAGQQASTSSRKSSLSGDGRFVAFDSSASLAPDDVSGLDYYVRDRQSGTSTRVSEDSAGSRGVTGADSSSQSADTLAADGSAVAFQSSAALVPGDGNGTRDVYVRSLRPAVAFNGVPASPNPVHFTIFNAFGEAGNTGQVLLSCSGTSPGIPIPDGSGRLIPLVSDVCTTLSLQSPFVFSGPVEVTGTAQTPIVPFPATPTGLTVFAAAVTIQLGPTAFISITEPTSFVTQ